MAESNDKKKMALVSRIHGVTALEKATKVTGPYGLVFLQPIGVSLTRGTHTYNVKSKEMVNSDGYELLAGGAGVRIFTPRILNRYDKEAKALVECGNPDIVTDDHGRIIAVWVRKIAAGFLPNGELSIVERTLYFNVESYFITSLLAKVDKEKTAGRYISLATWKAMPEKDKERRAFYIITHGVDDYDTVGVDADLSSPAIQDVLRESQSIKQMAERRATTICERLVYDHHPAIAQGDLSKEKWDGQTINIKVYNVKHTSTALEKMFNKLSLGEEPDLEKVDYDKETVTIEPEVVQAEGEGEAAPGEPVATEAEFTEEPTEPEEAPDKTDEEKAAEEELLRQSLLNQIRELRKQVGNDIYKPIEKKYAEAFRFANITEAKPKALQLLLSDLLQVATQEVAKDE